MARHTHMTAAVMCCVVLLLCTTAHARQLLDNPFYGGPAGGIINPAQSTAEAKALATGTSGNLGDFGGIFGGGVGGPSTSSSQASAVSTAQAGSVLANRLGLGGNNAQCASNALAKSTSSGGGAGAAQASGNSFAVSGDGLNGLAACGANANAVANTLSCRRFIVPFPCDLCQLTDLVGTNCDGLRLINPGLAFLNQGQTINLPPCNFGL